MCFTALGRPRRRCLGVSPIGVEGVSSRHSTYVRARRIRVRRSPACFDTHTHVPNFLPKQKKNCLLTHTVSIALLQLLAHQRCSTGHARAWCKCPDELLARSCDGRTCSSEESLCCFRSRCGRRARGPRRCTPAGPLCLCLHFLSASQTLPSSRCRSVFFSNLIVREVQRPPLLWLSNCRG